MDSSRLGWKRPGTGFPALTRSWWRHRGVSVKLESSVGQGEECVWNLATFFTNGRREENSAKGLRNTK